MRLRPVRHSPVEGGSGSLLHAPPARRDARYGIATMRTWTLTGSKTRCMPRCLKKRLDP